MKKKRNSLLEEERRMNELLRRVGYTGKYKGSPYSIPDYNVRKDLPELSNAIGNGPKRRTNTYTGSEFIGFATMHKSNAVPVTSQQQAIDIAQMRRS